MQNFYSQVEFLQIIREKYVVRMTALFGLNYFLYYLVGSLEWFFILIFKALFDRHKHSMGVRTINLKWSLFLHNSFNQRHSLVFKFGGTHRNRLSVSLSGIFFQFPNSFLACSIPGTIQNYDKVNSQSEEVK